MKKIATLISTYNEADRILDVVASVQSISTDIIILDNYSTDETVALVRDLPGVTVVKHNIPPTNYKERIRLFFDTLDSIESQTEYVTHLICSERFTSAFCDYLKKQDIFKYDAIACYRNAVTDEYPTHPYHLVYLIRSILKRHKTVRLLKRGQWNENACKIHAEWQPKGMHSIKSIPFWSAVIDYQRSGNILLNERKHSEYAYCEAQVHAKRGRGYLIAMLFVRPLAFFVYNLPYLVFMYSDQRLISVVQHCQYYMSVYVNALKLKSK
jgi:glycosyltransferase involved in cell wall biosynthesis